MHAGKAGKGNALTRDVFALIRLPDGGLRLRPGRLRTLAVFPAVAGAPCFWRRTGDFLLFARHWWCLVRKTTASTKNHWRSHAETHAEAMRTCFPPCTHGAHSAHSAQSVGAFDEQATSHSCNTVGPCSWCGPVNAIQLVSLSFNPLSSGSY
jgi:hypothetical protein